MNRCPWPANDELMIAYHDLEWGVPLHDDRALFELLVLEGFQAGLSWRSVLRKREAFRRDFVGFDPELVARFSEEDVARLLLDEGIIRNRAKVRASITNGQAFLKVRDEFGSFDRFIWQFTGGTSLVNHWEDLSADSCPLRRIGQHVARACTAGFQVRRQRDLLRLHAIRRHGERPPGHLLPMGGSAEGGLFLLTLLGGDAL